MGKIRVRARFGAFAALVLAAGLLGVAVAAPAVAESSQAVDNDQQNKLWECETRRTTFDKSDQDKLRCFSFRFAVPAGGIRTASVRVALGALGGLSDTDSLTMAVGSAFPACAPLVGKMTGCVVLHG